MPISNLPDSTLRAITSTLVLNDAASVLKELVDNALDAKASTVAIEIAANTLDVIQVKDNGTGIGVEDRQLICKRGCTSKISTIEDLERLGGSSLGFRGEALASVADLSDSVTITTRVDGETAGSMLKYGPAGALLSCSSASHPVGSTIRIKDFLKSIPVRKQTALKNASKTLSAIKKLLQSYAFARGTVRFSLKVLKSKNDNANWQYCPIDKADNLRDAAVNIIGKDVSGRCEVRTKTASGSGGPDVASDEYSIITLLASVKEDAVKLNNTGHYVSIDGRPVSAARGTAKEVVKLYRHYVRNCAHNTRELPASFDPLLVMHITCPRGSYDVNVEPAKDEVMFIDPEAVLALVESIFKDYFGQQSQSTEAAPKDNERHTSQPRSSFNLLLAKRSAPSIEPTDILQNASPVAATSSTSGQNLHQSQDTEIALLQPLEFNQTPVTSRRECSERNRGSEQVAETKLRSNMNGFDEEESNLPSPSLSPPITKDDAGEAKNDATRNPWSLAKLNATIRRPLSKCDESCRSTGEQSTSPTITKHAHSTSQTTPQSSRHRQPLGLRQPLPSPVTLPHSPELFQNPGPPNRSWASRQQRGEDLELESDQDIAPTAPTKPSLQGHEKMAKPLDGWTHPLRPRAELPSFKCISDMYDKDGRFQEALDGDISEIPLPRHQPALLQTPSIIDSHSHPQQTGPIGNPFRSPLLRSPAEAATSNNIFRLNAPQVISGSQQPPFKLSQSPNQELDQIMEFEHRKKAANAQQRKGVSKTTRGMSIAKLAKLQRSTTDASYDELSPEHMQAFQDHGSGVEPADSNAAFGSRFNDHDEHPDALQTSNPHRNRYLAAAKGLTRTDLNQPRQSVHVGDPLPGTAEIIDEQATTIGMAENDPRSYLMRQRFQTDEANDGGLTKTGLKVRRTKTQRLPLELVPAGTAVHNLVALVDFDVRVYGEARPDVDRYIPTGRNHFIAWTSITTDLVAWQADLTTLVEDMYRARVGDELVPPNLELDLRRMIKIHCDNI